MEGNVRRVGYRWGIADEVVHTCTHTHAHWHTHTLTLQIRQLGHQTLSLARGIAVWVVGEEQGSRSRGGREGELMENGVVSQLIGDALAGLQCLLFPSWLPDATMHCTDTIRPWLLPLGSTAALSAQLLQPPFGYGLSFVSGAPIPALWLLVKCVGGQCFIHCWTSRWVQCV